MAKMTSNFITKDYLHQEFQKFKEDLVKMKDEIVGEIQAMREEFQAHQFSHSRIDDTLKDHEERLDALEKP